MSDSISTTDVEIVEQLLDINQDINMKNMQIVINDNDNDDVSVAIQPIGLARCGLKILPSYLVPKEVTNWIKGTGIEVYFSGNKLLCENDAENYGCVNTVKKYM